MRPSGPLRSQFSMMGLVEGSGAEFGLVVSVSYLAQGQSQEIGG